MDSQELDTLTNEIEQDFMQPGGWKACRYLVSKLAIESYNEGLREFAWWQNGVEYVGTSGTTLKEALLTKKETKKP